MGVQNNQDMSKVETQPLTDEVKIKITSGDTKADTATKAGFTGLTKEELMVYAKDPYWIRIRWGLFILFWVIWVSMLVASVFIIIQAPKCPSPEPRQWYMKGPIYQVKVENFKDSNGDGKGDLKGIEDSLDYLVNTEVNSVWLTDFTIKDGVKSEYGTIEDFDSLVAKAQERGLKIIVDVASDDVAEAEFWLSHKVDGINMKSKDEALLEKVRTLLDEHTDADIMSPRVLLTDINLERNELHSLFGKNISDNNVSPLVHFPINKNLLQTLKLPLAAADIEKAIDASQWPTNAWPNYALGGDEDRVASRVGVAMADGMNMLLFLLPGTPFTYFGDEVAMQNSKPGMMDWSHWAANGTAKGKVTHYSIYKKLALLRHQESILFGETNAFSLNSEKVFGLTRVKRGNPGYLLAINLKDEAVEVDFSKIKNMPDSVRVSIQSIGLEVEVEEEKAGSFPSNAVPLKANQSVVFTFVPNFDNEGE